MHNDFFKRLQHEIKNLEKDIVQKVIAVEAERHHAENFRQEAFVDVAPIPWKARAKTETPQRALLVKSSAMKGHALKGRVRADAVEFRFPLDYMRIHNEGGVISGTFAVKAHERSTKKGKVSVSAHSRTVSITMPKRQYVGESATLKNRIQKKAEQLITQKLNNL